MGTVKTPPGAREERENGVGGNVGIARNTHTGIDQHTTAVCMEVNNDDFIVFARFLGTSVTKEIRDT